jgi:RHS repeat-associated protein
MIYGFINGLQVLAVSAPNASIPNGAATAGFYDVNMLQGSSFDEFRVSSSLRYTPNQSFAPPVHNVTDGSTQLLYHFDDYGIGKLPPTSVFRDGTHSARLPAAFGDSSGHGDLDVFANWSCGSLCAVPEFTYQPYSIDQTVSISELLGGGLPWLCTCIRQTKKPVNTATGEFWHTFQDFSIPGRGIALDLSHTYSSVLAYEQAQSQQPLGPLGYGWTGSYDMNLTFDAGGNPTIHAGNGSSTTFLYNGNAGAPAYAAPSRILASLTKSGSSYLLTDAQQNQYTFDSSGLWTQVADRNGYVTALAHSGGHVSSVTDPEGRTLTLTYNSSGLLQSVSDSASPTRTVTMSYDGNKNLVQVQDVGGGITTFTYDSNHLLKTMQDPNCNAQPSSCSYSNSDGSFIGVANIYDGSRRVATQYDNLGRKTTFVYDGTTLSGGPNGTTSIAPGTTLVTDPRGNMTTDEYVGNILISETQGLLTPQAATWTYAYDPLSQGRSLTIDPNGHGNSVTRDAHANPLSITDGLNRTETMSYNSFSEVTSDQDPLLAGTSYFTSYTYDPNGNLTQVQRPLLQGGSVIATQARSYVYDTSAGRQSDVTQITDENGKVWHYTYDQYGERTSVIDPVGDKATYAYDSVGRMISSVSANGNVTGGDPANYTTAFQPNAFGQDTLVTDPLGHQMQSTFDGNHNLTLATDANSHQTQYAYDGENELTQVTRADSSTLKTTYDGSGNVQTQVDGLNQTTSYAYDPLNRKSSSTDPLGRKTSYSYDSAGNLTKATDAMVNTTTNSYDAANQLRSVSFSDATPGVSYSYDADGQRMSMADGSGSTSYQFDSLHRLSQSTNGAGAAVAYGYDLKNQLTSIAYPGSTGTVARGYDDAGRLHTVQDWLSNQTVFNYDANSNLQQTVYANGVQANWTFDAANRLMQISDANGGNQVLNLSYTRDPANQLTAENSQGYGYNTINQLASGGNTTYTYDSADRLTQNAISGGNTSTLAYGAADQVQSMTTMNGSTQVAKLTYGFDSNGNRTSQTDAGNNTTSLAFDAANRLTNYGSSASYTYNGDGLRMSKTVAGTGEAFTYDIAQGLPLVIQDGSTNYVTGPGGLPLEQIQGSTATYYQQDQLGSTRALTNQSGAVVGTATYDAYGNPTAPTTGATTPFGYAGQYTDAESGLIYLRARFYDPSTGQFLSRDPAVATTRLPYVYTGDNPLSATDPSGLWGFINNFDLGPVGNFFCDTFMLCLAARQPAVIGAAGAAAGCIVACGPAVGLTGASAGPVVAAGDSTGFFEAVTNSWGRPASLIAIGTGCAMTAAALFRPDFSNHDPANEHTNGFNPLAGPSPEPGPSPSPSPVPIPFLPPR